MATQTRTRRQGGHAGHSRRRFAVMDLETQRESGRWDRAGRAYGNGEQNSQPRSRRHYAAARRRTAQRPRGFAAMDPRRQREIAAAGGRTARRGPRGFAAMNPETQRRIAARGGSAPHTRPRGFAAMGAALRRRIAAAGGRALHRRPRGFAAMTRADRRRLAARGGHANQGARPRNGMSSMERNRFAAMKPARYRETTSRGRRMRRGN